MKYYIEVLKKYVLFSGRAGRAEYWWFFLFNLIIMIVLGIIDGVIASARGSSTGGSLLSILYSLGVFLPSLAVTVRRLHDTGRSGPWIFISFVPLAGPFILLYFMILDSQAGSNMYGANPKGVAGAAQPPSPQPPTQQAPPPPPSPQPPTQQ